MKLLPVEQEDNLIMEHLTPLSQRHLEEMFRKFLTKTLGTFETLGLKFDIGDIIFYCNPHVFRERLNDWLHWEGNTINIKNAYFHKQEVEDFLEKHYERLARTEEE